jgi:hypothetical protein
MFAISGINLFVFSIGGGITGRILTVAIMILSYMAFLPTIR